MLRNYFLFITASLLLSFTDSNSEIVINEVQSSNAQTLFDEDNDSPDWIEFYNRSDNAVNLQGYSLFDKDDVAKAWKFPDITIEGKSYLLVHASDKHKYKSDYYTIEASGIGILSYTAIDQFLFLYQEKSEDFSIRMCIRSVQVPFVFGRAGLIVRSDTTATAPYAGVFVSNEESNSIRVQHRHTEQTNPDLIHFSLGVSYPDYISLTRKGDSLSFCIESETGYCLQERTVYFPKQLSKEYIGIAASSAQIDTTGKFVISDLSIDGEAYDPADLTKMNIDGNNSHGKYRGTAYYKDELHAEFKLSDEGESLYMWDNNDNLIDELKIPALKTDVSYGRFKDGSSVSRYMKPTPGDANDNMYKGILAPIVVSSDSIFHDSAFNAVLEHDEVDAEIYYTLDGSFPDEKSAKYGGGSLNIDSSCVLKAIAFKDGYLQSDMLVRTYLINEPRNLPVFCLSASPESLWSLDSGFFEANLFSDKRMPVSFEYYDNSEVYYGTKSYLKLHGHGPARALPQRSFRVHSSNSLGDVSYTINVFGGTQGYELDKILIRNGGQDWYNSLLRDPFHSVLAQQIEHLEGLNYRAANIYINGKYYAMANLREKFDEDHLKYKHNISEKSINVMSNLDEINYGSSQTYYDTFNYILQNDMKIQSNFDVVSEGFDLLNMCDYAVLNLFSMNFDWPQNNLKYWSSSEIDGKWRWVVWDMDWTTGMDWATWPTWGNVNKFYKTADSLPSIYQFSNLFIKLLENEKYKSYYLNRTCDLLNTTLEPSNTIPILDSLVAIISDDISRQKEKWGQSIDNWNTQIDRFNTFLQLRPHEFRMNLSNHYDLEGYSKIDIKTIPENAGRIKISTLQLDSLPWSGYYLNNVPINVEVIPNPGYEFEYWSGDLGVEKNISIALTDSTELTAYFKTDEITDMIVINEIMYTAAEAFECGDWFELFNAGENDVDISTWTVKDENDEHLFIIPQGIILKQDEYLVISNDLNAFEQYYVEDIRTLGELDFGYGGNDIVRLYDHTGALADYVDYDNDSPWPEGADKTGFSIELKNPYLDNNIGENWMTSHDFLGSPGKVNPIYSSIEDNDPINAHIEVYPNPTSDYVFISGSGAFNSNYKLIDIKGSIFHTGKINSEKFRINLSALESGAYYLVLSRDNSKTQYLFPIIVNK